MRPAAPVAFAALVVLVIVVAVAVVVTTTTAAAGGPRAPTHREFRGPRLSADIVVPLSRDQYRAAYWLPARVGGRAIHALADTGSPYLVVPQSLPCPPGVRCPLTGERTRITYGDGTMNDAVFAHSPVSLGDNHFPSLVFGGSDEPGEGTESANDAVAGLAPLKAPHGFKDPVGASLVEQIGATALELDLRREFDATLRIFAHARPWHLWGAEHGDLVAEGPLVPRGRLWTLGVDHASDFYVVELPVQPGLGGLRYLIIDTGSTLTLLPGALTGDVRIRFPHGALDVRGKDLGTLPSMYVGPRADALNSEVGILGNRSMTGFRVVLDLVGGTCRFYR